MGVAMECTLHLECTWSGVGVYFYWWVIWPSPRSGILVYTYNIRSVVGVYTPVGVVTEWLWSVHSKLECTLRQGKGYLSLQFRFNMSRSSVNMNFVVNIFAGAVKAASFPIIARGAEVTWWGIQRCGWLRCILGLWSTSVTEWAI